ncbi:MAG TPA: extracellular solute-binding protein [Actinospica sp.]|jgi:raffinose/stachyose/melibiose transport system substrate-binding protein|nr:extracellular solute-binding protein [Actinospica sp.]
MTKFRSRLAAMAAACVALGMTVAGCGSSSGGSESGPITLTVYSWKGNAATPEDVPQINAAFEKAYPNIKLNFQFLSAGATIAQKLQPEFLAGDAPDVFMTDPTTMRQYQKDGYLADLSDQSWVSDLTGAIKPFVTVSGKTYAAPLDLVPIGLFANMGILKQAGITSFPTTNTELLADLKTLKSKNLPGLEVPDKGGYTSEAIINGVASTLVYKQNKNWDADYVAGKVDFSDWTSSVEQFNDLGTSGLVDFKDGLGVDEWGQGVQDFEAGKTAFLYQGAWNLTSFVKAQPSTQFGPWAGDDSSQQWGTVFAGVNWSVNAASSHLDAAEKYVRFWTQAENLIGYLKADAGYSPYTNGTSPTSAADALETKAFNAGAYRILGADSWFTGANETTMGTDVQSLMLGQITPSALTAKWTQEFKTSK